MAQRLNDTRAITRRGIRGPDPLSTGDPVPFGVGLGVVMGSSSFSRASQARNSGNGQFRGDHLKEATEYLCQGSTSRVACPPDDCK